ncbi:hypothetical protein [Amphritea japonica]|nr:hypothetical protein [Amphritea japonica]
MGHLNAEYLLCFELTNAASTSVLASLLRMGLIAVVGGFNED